MTGRATSNRVRELEDALLRQWWEAHFDHCGREHGDDQDCMWAPPRVLGMTTGQAVAAMKERGLW